METRVETRLTNFQLTSLGKLLQPILPRMMVAFGALSACVATLLLFPY